MTVLLRRTPALAGCTEIEGALGVFSAGSGGSASRGAGSARPELSDAATISQESKMRMVSTGEVSAREVKLT